ncbi:MAG: outer membrane protein assembly factor BamA [Verrucomicrobiota bacterium]|jgi:outer membrane protein insertion porin family
MNRILKNLPVPARPLLGVLLLFLPFLARGQIQGSLIHKIYIQHIGPPAVSDAFIRANIRSKEGERLFHATIEEDEASLYATGFFFNVHVAETNVAEGVDLTYQVQGKPIVTDIKIIGNKKLSLNKLKKKLTSKIGQPLDPVKLFHNAQDMQELYQKAGYQDATVKVLPFAIDEIAGRATVTLEVKETEKIRVTSVVFDGARVKTQKELRKVLKTRRHWMFSWLTGSGVLKKDEFEDDMDRLLEFYQNDGYIDFAVLDKRFEKTAPNRMVIHIVISEGKQYKVGNLAITGNTLFSTNDFIKGKTIGGKLMVLTNVPGAIFKPVAFDADVETIRDMYGSRGYLSEYQNGSTVIRAARTANTTSGTMDIAINIQEGDKSYIEKIEIKGNEKTKDRVIRRELAVYPGEVYNMVNVKISKGILEQMEYFSKVDVSTEDTEIANYKNLVIGLQEQSMSSASIGAGFSSVESIVGFVEVKMKNFDLFNPPTFTGAGQKLQLIASVGALYQDYEIAFTEPYFLGRKLILGVNLFHREVDYDSLNSMYTETYDGATISLTKSLGRYLRGGVSYTPENVHVSMNSGFRTNTVTNIVVLPGGGTTNGVSPQNITTNIFDEHGSYLENKFGFSLDYDSRNDYRNPNHGQHTEFLTQIATPPGDTDFYKLELRSSWFFKGLAPGHILQLDARGGVVDGYGGTQHIPIFERWFLGGLGSLRGYRYHQIGPADGFGEPLGGDTYFFGDAEYSIPLVKIVRLAWFYDMGNVFADPYSFKLTQQQAHFYSDNVGIGLRIVLPIGGPQGVPLRLDYGIPMTHDANTGSGGRVQIGVGYTRDF